MSGNTKLELMYRDGANYKAFLLPVLAGIISDSDIDLISAKLAHLDPAEPYYIIAQQVGLPSPCAKFVGYDGFPNADMDHCYTKLTDFAQGRPLPSSLHTDDAPTIELTVAQFVANLRAVECWDEDKEWQRMQQMAAQEAKGAA